MTQRKFSVHNSYSFKSYLISNRTLSSKSIGNVLLDMFPDVLGMLVFAVSIILVLKIFRVSFISLGSSGKLTLF